MPAHAQRMSSFCWRRTGEFAFYRESKGGRVYNGGGEVCAGRRGRVWGGMHGARLEGVRALARHGLLGQLSRFAVV